MPMRLGNVKKSRTTSQIKSNQKQSRNTNNPQYVLITKNLVPVAKSVPIAPIKQQSVDNQRKNRSITTWKNDTTPSTFLKPPLVSTSGQGFPRGELQDWIRESRLSIDVKKTNDSKSSLQNDGQKPMRPWQIYRDYKEQLRGPPEKKQELPFPYNPDLWKVDSSSSLLSMESLLTLPQAELTSWESASGSIAPASTAGSSTLQFASKKNSVVNDLGVKQEQGKKCTVIKEYAESRMNSTLSKVTTVDSKLVAHSISSEIHNPSIRTTLSKLMPQSSKSNLMTSPDESQYTISTESDQTQVETPVIEETAIWQEIGNLLTEAQKEIAPEEKVTPKLVSTSTEAHRDENYPFKRKYSWQVADAVLQTSRTLLQDLLKSEQERMEVEKENENLRCCYKYSWQIIGIETQTTPKDYEDSNDYFEVRLKPRDSTEASARSPSETTYRKVKFCKFLTNQQTQTCASKENQTNFTEIYAMSRKNVKICV